MATPPELTTACRLVFLTAGPRSNDAEIAALARGPIDWLSLVLIAEREHAVATVWRALDRVARDAVPQIVFERLRRNGMVSDFKMMHLQQRLQATAKALREHEVRGMLLKGAALGSSIYGSFTERPMSDIDLIVHRGDVAESRLAILETGWGEHQIPELADLLSDHHHLVPFFDKSGTGLRFELHVNMFPAGHPFNFSEEEVWQSAVQLGEEYSGVFAPSPTYLLFHACLHFAYSHTMQFGPWRTFRDLTELTRSPKLDWARFIEVAQRTRAATSCYWALRLARRLANTPVPDDALDSLRAPTPELARRALERHFIANIAPWESQTCPSVTLDRFMWRAAIRPKWSGHQPEAPQAKSAQSWEAALHGTKPAAAPSRVLRQIAHARTWWRYLTRTLRPLRG